MVATINASVSSSGIVSTADGSGILKVQSNGVTTNALAWVSFDGTTSPGTIRSQYNVSSVTKNSTGDYTVNFTSALSDSNYAAVVNSGNNAGGSLGAWTCPYSVAASLTTSFRVVCYTYAGGVQDQNQVMLAIFGN